MALFVAHYNFCRPHEALDGDTPAMALGLTNRIWPASVLIQGAELALNGPAGRKIGRFRVIEGGA